MVALVYFPLAKRRPAKAPEVIQKSLTPVAKLFTMVSAPGHHRALGTGAASHPEAKAIDRCAPAHLARTGSSIRRGEKALRGVGETTRRRGKTT